MENEQFSHESHGHALTFYEESEEKLKTIAKLSGEEIGSPLCYGCFETIHGPAYFCEICGDFWLHKSCFELPSELPKHSLHSIHSLTLIVRPPSLAGFFVCDGCRDMSPGFAFHCKACRFNLDVKCAISTDGEDLRSRKGVKDTEIPYFGDEHLLVSFNAKQEVEKTCTGCQLILSGPAYGCLDCEFYLHESCKDMPSEIQHPYHPPHPLRAQVAEYGSECDACHMPIRKVFYRCSECDFNLHILCANKSLKVSSSFKYKGHEHDLYYFAASYFNEYSLCNTCLKVCKGSYYICLECKYYVHLDCIPLPRVVENDGHSRDYSHYLTLKDCFVEDDSGQYYCELCEKERDPTYHVYYCDQCPDRNPYLAHIECLMSELMKAELNSARTSAKMVDDGDVKGDTKCLALVKYTTIPPENQIKLKGFRHEHILVPDNKESDARRAYCSWCDCKILGPGYICQQCSGNWHISCAKSPPQKTHFLHSQHTLTMFFPHYFEYFICDGCRDLCHDVATYHCRECHFFLDMKCASLPDDQREQLKKTESKTIYFCHKDKLTRANCARGIKEKCEVCQLRISGATYCCINCNFFLHESCLETPQEIQHQYHLQHPLLGRDFDGNPKKCRACNLQIWDIAYYCDICDFALHFTCATYLTSTLKHEFHLAPSIVVLNATLIDILSAFHCHLKFSKKTIIWILLHMENVVEDDYGEYYCEICRDKRNPNHPVYCCKMCKDNWFIAHIECVIKEGDTSLEILEWWNKDLGSDYEETSSKEDDGTSLSSHSDLESYAMGEHNTEGPGITELD
ncbi:hypothetical protein NC651_039640 [Populus alba x Populus x berolinensis]|nr:hypothetical protein NC651_039640 [Populus alba x Populus x berolinensis]